MNETKKFTLTLDEQQVNYLMGVLQKQTLGEAIGVFLSINQQVQKQLAGASYREHDVPKPAAE